MGQRETERDRRNERRVSDALTTSQGPHGWSFTSTGTFAAWDLNAFRVRVDAVSLSGYDVTFRPVENRVRGITLAELEKLGSLWMPLEKCKLAVETAAVFFVVGVFLDGWCTWTVDRDALDTWHRTWERKTGERGYEWVLHLPYAERQPIPAPVPAGIEYP